MQATSRHTMKTYEHLDDVRLGYLSQKSMADVHGSYGETKLLIEK